MSWWTRVRSWTKSTVRSTRMERDMDEEMRFHVEAHATELMKRGMTREKALRQARLEFGGLETAKAQCRDAVGVSFLETLMQDLRHSVRGMLRTPVFALTAVIVLALGIGATTAIFSVVDAVLLRPLAYRDSGRLVTILMSGTGPVSVANYIDWRDQSRSFSTMGAADYWSPNLTGVDSPEHITGLKVTQNLFPMLGIEPMLGRLFLEGEDKDGADREVILSHRLWQRRFSSDPAVLGKPIVLDGNAFVIVGVMPPEFQFAPFWATKAELWVPNAFGARIHSRGGNSLRIFARLKDGVSLTQARAEIASITARLEQQFPGTNRNVVVTPLKEKVVGSIETPLLVLLAAVGFVLLITCANVAHMLLARAATRQKEIAVRAALGARRGRLIRQFLTESILLGGVGGALGLLLAVLGTRALIALSPANIPRVQTVSIDAHAALFLLAATILTSVGFGLVPALQASSVNVNDTLKEGGRGGTEGVQRNRLRSLLVVSEFALALMLLIGAGLMIRTFAALEAVDPGFNPHHVISMIVSVAGSKEAEPGRREFFYRQLIERVRSLPGVEAAGAINHLPLAGDLWGWSFLVEGRPKPRPGEAPKAVYRMVTPGYFAAMRLPIVRGHDITDADNITAPGVVIINEQAARQYWPGEDPIGKRVSFDDDTTNPTNWLTVIGIAKDAKQDNWTDKATPEAYLAAFQNHDYIGDSGTEASKHMDYITLVARSVGDPAALASEMKQAAWSFDRNLAISQVVTMDGVVAEANAQPRFEMMLLSIFAAVALVLAAVGIYGMISYSASQRTHEIGVRMSLGATRGDVLLLVVRQGIWLAVAGSAAGLTGSLLLSRLMGGLLYGVKPTDPVTFAAVAFGLAVVAMLACYIPARRAMRIDPMAALRYE
ncbi:MAG TPA: ABC transporter permease [Candidatus Eisenbacteria bacterium]|nr:ABC transporter permease [Candidatus Eisenbacteria bacterium]